MNTLIKEYNLNEELVSIKKVKGITSLLHDYDFYKHLESYTVEELPDGFGVCFDLKVIYEYHLYDKDIDY